MTEFRMITEEDYQRMKKIIPDYQMWKDIHISSLKIPKENIKELNDILNRCPGLQR